MTAKAYRQGTHRAVPPAATVARVQPLMPALGITRLADVTGLDRIGVPVFQAIRPLSRSVSVSQGKGLDADAARASALMEAAETWHAERADLPLRLARERDLRRSGAGVVGTAALPRVAGSPRGGAADLPILWAEGRGLATGEPAWLPYELVHADYTLPQPAGTGLFLASTNGLASGNTREEAVVHGLCELIERDAVTLWFRRDAAARAATAVDLAGLDDPACRGLVDRVRAAGFDLAAWDVTGDLGVPAHLCLLADARDPDGHGGLGAGCHPAREVAFLRALTEAVQVRMTYISGARDDIAAEEYTAGSRAERLAKARLLATRQGGAGLLRLADLPTRQHPDFAADAAWLLERLAAAGLGEPLMVDLTRPDIGLGVVRVVAPGLEGPDDHPSYTPGPRARAVRPHRLPGAT